jgi:DNA helicase-2/ATP-dependent DNA helicase PcrA
MVDEMRQLIRDDVARKRIAVLYRSNASRVIETPCSTGVPYKVWPLSGPRDQERASPTFACWKIRAMTLARAVNFPPRGSLRNRQLQDVAQTNGLRSEVTPSAAWAARRSTKIGSGRH